MHGILLVDKPAGWTSFDVVNFVRKQVAQAENKKPKQIKVGHAGTLDPFATGLLIVLVGKDYTRRAAEFSKLDKTYELTMRLGAASTTGDPEGEITTVSDAVPTRQQLAAALPRFTGQITQTPPAYSAIKVNGQRAYRLARAGQAVELEPRSVRINRLQLVSYAYPEARLTADVSSGTYIRALVADLGRALGSGAYTTELRRTAIGSFQLAGAVPVKALSDATKLPGALHK